MRVAPFVQNSSVSTSGSPSPHFMEQHSKISPHADVLVSLDTEEERRVDSLGEDMERVKIQIDEFTHGIEQNLLTVVSENNDGD